MVFENLFKIQNRWTKRKSENDMAFKMQNVRIQGVENYSSDMHDSRRKDEESTKTFKFEMEGFKSLTQDTTLHGARFLFVDNILRRAIWSLALLSCFVCCSYQVYLSVRAFYDYPFHTTLRTDTATDESDLPFPAVTLCNVNPLNTRRYRHLYEVMYQESPTEDKIERKLEDISLMLRRSQKVLREEFKNRNPKFFHRAESAREESKRHELLSHQIDEMLLPKSTHFNSCSMNGLICGPKNFSTKKSLAYGQCYTFNSGKADHPLLNATLAGKDSGLKLRLNIERDSYITNPVTPTVGLTVILHDQKSFPFMEGFGIVLQPGISTFCTIRRRKVSLSIYQSHYP